MKGLPASEADKSPTRVPGRRLPVEFEFDADQLLLRQTIRETLAKTRTLQAKRAVNQTLDIQGSTRRSSRCSTSTRPVTATRSASAATRSWPAPPR